MADPTNEHTYRTVRARWWDYRDAGWYFVTICSDRRQLIFGDVVDGAACLNDLGRRVAGEWLRTPVLREEVTLGAWGVMPNHRHGIVIVEGDPQRQSHAESRLWHANNEVRMPHPRGAEAGSLGAIIGQFKLVTTKRINRLRNTPGAPV